MKSFTFPGGRAYLTVRSTRPDPASRYNITVSDGAQIGAAGLIELGKFLIECGKEARKEDEVTPDLDLSVDADTVVVTNTEQPSE